MKSVLFTKRVVIKWEIANLPAHQISAPKIKSKDKMVSVSNVVVEQKHLQTEKVVKTWKDAERKNS